MYQLVNYLVQLTNAFRAVAKRSLGNVKPPTPRHCQCCNACMFLVSLMHTGTHIVVGIDLT